MKSDGKAARLLTSAALPAMLLLLVGKFGCGSSNDSAPADPAQDESKGATLITVDAAELPIGVEMPPLDGGRVSLSYPSNWEHFAKTADYVVRFHSGNSTKFPRIMVTADKSPYDGITTVDGSNYDRLLQAVKQEVDDRESLLEAPLAMKLGDGYFVRYVLNSKLGDVGAERQVLVTVLRGRRYVVDLEITKRTIHEYKNFGYAVAASLRWIGDSPASEGSEEPAPGGDQDGNADGSKGGPKSGPKSGADGSQPPAGAAAAPAEKQ